MIGRRLDRYEIESKLGEGGMGVVYRARDTQLNRTVAIKVLPPGKTADPERRQRFVQEAKAASALNHPHIVTVHDIRVDAGIDFIVMEYAGTTTLDRVISAKGLGVTRALRYGIQIADALARAHEIGIVHRDLKPSNVIVTDDDDIKILDFGLAKLVEPTGGAGDGLTRTAPLTESGAVVGTAAYMSPEQAEGRKIDARSDIFSFGLVLYEMVTGRRAFEGASTLSVLSEIVNADPTPPSALVPSLPPDAERTILRCLRKDPARRFQTMADLKVALEDLSQELTGAPAQTAAAQASRPPGWMLAALVAVALVAAFGAWQWSRTRGREVPLHAVQLTALPGIVRSPTFSPDGNHIAFSWNGPRQDNRDVYVQQIGAGAPLQLTTDPAEDYSPLWSPDGRTIAFLRQTSDPRRQEVRLVPPLGGPERKLTDIRPRNFLRPATLAWCPDARCLIVTDSPDAAAADALFVVAIESGEKRQLTKPAASEQADTDPAVSPDGRWLVFRRDVAPLSGQLQLAQLGAGPSVTTEPRSLTPILLGAEGPRWISDSEIIFSAKGSLWRMDPSANRAAERVIGAGQDGVTPAFSPPRSGQSSRLAYVRDYTDMNIWRIDTPGPGQRASSPPVVAIASTRRDAQPQFSPDGGKVVFMSDRTGEWEVWAADASGGNAVQLTFLRANPGFPRWAPDGKTIVFHSNAEDRPRGDVYVVSVDGGTPRNLTSHPANDPFASFSRDGRWIYFSSNRTGLPLIWKVPVSGGDPVQVSQRSGLLAIESLDGASLYYVETAIGSGEMTSLGRLWRVPLGGGEPAPMVDGVASTAFDVTERGIYYIEQLQSEARLRFVDFASRQSTIIAGNLGRIGTGLTASRDGRTILYSRIDSSVNDLMLVENFR